MDTCAWCGKPAVDRFEVQKKRKLKTGLVPAKYQPVCQFHLASFQEQSFQQALAKRATPAHRR
jgi:hypothetical protein